MKKKVSAFILILCLAVGSVAGYKILSTLLEYKEGVDEYKSLLAYTSAAAQKEDEIEDGLPECPIDVDWDELKRINPDICGWLYVGALDMSYPIVQGKTNDEYLHRTFKRQYNFSGSIFLDEQNNNDFNDPNSIIYGHNMKNGSMFGILKHLQTEEKYKEDPYFWILTPESKNCYQMFSLKNVGTTSRTYLLFTGTDQKFLDWAAEQKEESEISLDAPAFNLNSRIATLSTCTNDSSHRFVVQGVKIN